MASIIHLHLHKPTRQGFSTSALLSVQFLTIPCSGPCTAGRSAASLDSLLTKCQSSLHPQLQHEEGFLTSPNDSRRAKSPQLKTSGTNHVLSLPEFYKGGNRHSEAHLTSKLEIQNSVLYGYTGRRQIF